MKIALHTARDRSEPGRLLGGTYVWGFDAARGERFEHYEELAHTITITSRDALEERIEAELEILTERTESWARSGHERARDEDRASRFARFLRDPSAYFSHTAREEENRMRYELSIPNLTGAMIRTLNLPIPHDLPSVERSARIAIPPYAVLEEAPADLRDAARRRTHVAIGRLTADEVSRLPVLTFDLEVMNWQPIEPEATTREGLLDIIEDFDPEAFDVERYALMDTGLVRKHARHALNLERDERIYDAVVRAPDGAYRSYTSLPVASTRVRGSFGEAEIIACDDQDAITEALAREFTESTPVLIAGHNHIAYDIPQLERLGARMDVGADGTGSKTRFALAGSTIEERVLPDGRIDEETHRAFLTDRGWRGLDAIDPSSWMRYVDELTNTKLETVTRALTGTKARKLLNHEELEAIVQAHEHPHRAREILEDAGLSGDVEALIERERAYALNDVFFSAQNHERIAPTVASLALAFDATLSEISTTSPEAHASLEWSLNGREPIENTRIIDPRYAHLKDKHGFTAQGAFARYLNGPGMTGRHEVILARRTIGRRAADAIEHPTLDHLLELMEDAHGFERGWVSRYVDAMLTEPLYALATAGTSPLRRDANAWRLGLTRIQLDDLDRILTNVPNIEPLASMNAHVLFPATDHGYETVERLARDGWIEPLESGVALVHHGVIYEGSRRMRAGIADPGSKLGHRNEFTARMLPPIIDRIIEGDLEGALDKTRSAYESFDEHDTAITKRIGKDARDTSIRARGAIYEEARRIDARKGDVVTLAPDLSHARARHFGFSDAPDAGLFGNMYEPAHHDGFLSGPVLAAFGIGPRSHRPRWNAFADYVATGDAHSRDDFLKGSDL